MMAGIAAASAALLAYASGRNPEVAYAVDGNFDNLNLNGQVTLTTPVVNTQRDIHTTTNLGGLRFYNASSLTGTPDGAAIQFWGNGSGLPGQAFIDAGSHNSGAVILRTAGTGIPTAERFRINAAGDCSMTGNLAVSGQKQFVMDHPLDPDNKYLYHSVIEAPEQINVYGGTVTTDAGGNAVVQLPAYFEAINRDFRYQLTTINVFASAIIAAKVKNNQFTIKTDKPGVEVCWQVSGVRNDARARANPFVAERPKQNEEVGSRIHPEDFGLPQDRGVGFRRSPENLIRKTGPGGGPGR